MRVARFEDEDGLLVLLLDDEEIGTVSPEEDEECQPTGRWLGLRTAEDDNDEGYVRPVCSTKSTAMHAAIERARRELEEGVKAYDALATSLVKGRK